MLSLVRGFCPLFLLFRVPAAVPVTLSNVFLPTDQYGAEIFTGDGSVLKHSGFYYFYFNDWSTSCPGVDCCNTSEGCAGHCYEKDDQPPYTADCRDLAKGSSPYGFYHFVRVYRTQDFKVFENLGIALDVDDRPPGVMFRPHVVFNEKTGLFVMWMDFGEDASKGSIGYRVATSTNPSGPFVVTSNLPIRVPGEPQSGDYHLFIDDDGSAYHVRRSPYGPPRGHNLTIVQLNDSYTGPLKLIASLEAPKEVEAPVMFKRKGKYYVLSGVTCTACIVGSNMYVHQADSVEGPWNFLGDVGSQPGVPYDPHNPSLYVTQAQGTSIFEVPAGDDSTFVWVGNQWNSGLAKYPPGPRNHDLLYWAALPFNADGSIRQLQYTYETTFEMDPLRADSVEGVRCSCYQWRASPARRENRMLL